MKEYVVIVSVEVLDIVKANDKDEAVEIVEEKLFRDKSLLMDNLMFEVNEV